MVPPGLDRPSLASGPSTALPTTPGAPREGGDFLLERMVKGNRECTRPIHLGHLTEKIRPMIRSPLEDVVLPLMNHFVRQRAHDFLLAVLAPLGNLREQGKRKANLSLGRRAKAILIRSGPRPSMTDEHADRRGHSAAPHEVDRGQQACEIAAIQLVPLSGQILQGHWRGLTWRHVEGVIPIL